MGAGARGASRPSCCLFAALLLFGACTEKTAPGPKPKAAVATLVVTGPALGPLLDVAPRLASLKGPDVALLSVGGLFTGDSVGASLGATPTVEALKALGYRAVSPSGGDFDTGLVGLERLARAAGVTLLAANLRGSARGEAGRFVPWTLLEVGGLKVGVVGLASGRRFREAVPVREDIDEDDVALATAIGAARGGGAQAIILLVGDCLEPLRPRFAAHPEWAIDAAVSGPCDAPTTPSGFGASVVSLSKREDLAVLRLQQTASGVAVDVRRESLPGAAADTATFDAIRARAEAASTTPIGFSGRALPGGAPRVARLVATALRDELGADAAVMGEADLGQLPSGPLTRQSVATMLPRPDGVVIVTVKGEVLQMMRTLPGAAVLTPKRLEPAREYRVATSAHVYFGADGLGFEPAAPTRVFQGETLQAVVARWLEKRATTVTSPLAP